jgi:hypothetical protein
MILLRNNGVFINGDKSTCINSDLKAKSFEKFMQLDRLGYTNFKTRVHTTGMEFDIEAKT